MDLLEAYNKVPIPFYNYSFLVNFTEQFIKFANIIISIGIGAIISFIKCFALIDPLLVKLVLLILVIKSCYNIFFWYIKRKVLNLVPFDIDISNI
jgi:hypothetical protein